MPSRIHPPSPFRADSIQSARAALILSARGDLSQRAANSHCFLYSKSLCARAILSSSLAGSSSPSRRASVKASSPWGCASRSRMNFAYV
jgi:hypothetical protein